MGKYSIEEKLSDYIDALNSEQMPEMSDASGNGQYDVGADGELEKLMSTVRLVRTMREPAMPDEEFPHRLAQTVAAEIQKENWDSDMDGLRRPAMPVTEPGHGLLDNKPDRKLPHNKPGRKWAHNQSGKSVKRILSPFMVLAASLLLVVLIGQSGLFNRNVVYAMEKAVSKLSNYHGILEVRSRNANGEEWPVRRLELWAEGDNYAIKQDDGTVTVNNGQKKWQINHKEKEVVILPLLPDPTRYSFDLRDEARQAVKYPHTVVGTEEIAGRKATKLAISPPGGMEYFLWVDTETNLPIQLQTAMQNALQTTYTFVSFEPNTGIESRVFEYRVPEGYKVVEDNPGQLAATIEEAAAISGFVPLLPEGVPTRILAFQGKIVLDYGNTVITEALPEGEFVIAVNGSLGTAAGGPLEIWWERLRWRQNGIEIQVEGEQRIELARQIAPDLAVPDPGEDLAGVAQVKVSVDMNTVEADQKQVDRGSSPWQLDPLQVSLVFVNLKATPDGINGEPEIPMESFKLVKNNSAEAVVDVSEGPVKRVYLKRLIRQDETGIWSVVGYDPR